uniref:Reticulon-like protein n=1 Tax=Lygus hesperus TaxID=30085 RepID=A0A0A9W420_LYGHE
METSGGISKDFPGDLGAGKGVSSTDPLSGLLSGSVKSDKGDKELGITETDLLGYDPAAPSLGLSETASKETNRFLDELMSDAMNIVPNLAATKDENEGKSTDSKKLIDDFDFGFEKPLPPEPLGATSDFLKSETGMLHDNDLMKAAPTAPKDDFLSTPEPPAEKSRTPSPAPREETPSPVPPPVPKHQPVRDESPEPYEPTQTPEPEFKPVEEAPREPTPPPVRPREPSPPPVRPREPTPPPREPTPPPPVRPREPTPPPQKPVEPPPPTPKPVKKISTEDIGAKDIRSKLMESLLYWRDPKKSGAVFGVTMLTLLSLTAFSLISVVAYLCLFTLGGTICFRIYKSIMQAVQKTSDGHPFKDLLELDISIPEDKVNEISKYVVAYVNSSLATLRSLVLVEDLIDSIKFLVLSWVLTYIGACFNGLTLIILGVILLFSLPTVYEKNKAQIDVYVKIAMDKLSIITNKMRAAVPEGKKEEKKDQ